MNIFKLRNIAAAVGVVAALAGISAFTNGPSSLASPIPGCSRAQLSPSVYGGVTGAAGTEYYNIRLQNNGNECVVIDAPNVAFAYADNFIASPYATRTGPDKTVVLQNGWSAHSILALGNAYNYPMNKCAPVATSKILIVPPEPVGYKQTKLTFRSLDTQVCALALPAYDGPEARISPIVSGK